jgi:acyl dehydratase
MLTLTGIEDVRGYVGKELGVSEWHLVTQEAINEFADVTGDDYWIHTDPVRAVDTPFGGTIAHGYYTLSLAPMFAYAMFSLEGFAFGVNYGVNRVRFPAPMPVGERVRMRAKLLAVDDVPGGLQLTVQQTFEREDADKPVCVAEALTRVYTG